MLAMSVGEGYYQILMRMHVRLMFMVCDLCGHLSGEHKAIAATMHYCNLCRKVESHACFGNDTSEEPLTPIEILARKMF